MLEQHERGPVPAGELGPDLPGRFGDRGRRAGLGDNGQVAGLATGRQPHPEVSNALPVGGADRVPPERFVGDELTERRQAIWRGWSQGLHRPFNSMWRDANGERQESTEYHSIVLYGRISEMAADYAVKGRAVYVEGRSGPVSSPTATVTVSSAPRSSLRQ